MTAHPLKTVPTVDPLGLDAYARKRTRLSGMEGVQEKILTMPPVDQIKAHAEARGKTFVSFANYDYLGLADDPRVAQAAKDAVDVFGVGVSASRLVGGERSFHREFEAELATFTGAEQCIALVSGYLTNMSLISYLIWPTDLIILDDLSHNSLMSGAAAFKGKTVTYPHNDLEALERLLVEHRANHRHCLVVAEGLYSMDGDIADLAGLIALKERYDAWLLLDEAHSLGVLGDTGKGLWEHSGIDPGKIDLMTGTLSKSLVTCGGYIGGSKSVIEWLRASVPGFVYSVGIAPPVTAAASKSLEILIDESQRVVRLQQLAEYFVRQAQALGLDTGSAVGRGIVPIIFKDQAASAHASLRLIDEGMFCPPIMQVGVPRDKPRLRFFLSAKHTEAHIDNALRVVAGTLDDKVRPLNQQSSAGFLPD